MAGSDRVFAGSIPEIYEKYLVPLLFVPYANDLANRVAARSPRRVLEVAAGTGVVTRAMASTLPGFVDIVATDLNQPMLDQAAALGTSRPVEWRQADALELPFPDASFDAVVCQFGVMFFPDKARAFTEFRRVLRPRGTLIFNVWDRIEANDFAATVTAALATLYPDDPPRFLVRTPHGYSEYASIGRDLLAGGFAAPPEFIKRAERSCAPSAREPAVAFCQGTPLRSELEARGAAPLEEATEAAAEQIAKRFGRDSVEGRMQAHVVIIER